jgi:ribosome-associated translation inhibitor RaiA
MQIQINDPHEQVPDPLARHIEETTQDKLSHLAARLTRIEVHIKDLNANKGGIDKRCLIEARPRGLDPLVAEHDAASVRDAFHGALERIERVLEHRLGRLADRNRERPA